MVLSVVMVSTVVIPAWGQTPGCHRSRPDSVPSNALLLRELSWTLRECDLACTRYCLQFCNPRFHNISTAVSPITLKHPNEVDTFPFFPVVLQLFDMLSFTYFLTKTQCAVCHKVVSEPRSQFSPTHVHFPSSFSFSTKFPTCRL